MLGLVAYPSHGLAKTITAAIHTTTVRSINRARRVEGQYLVSNGQTTTDELLVREFFDNLQS